MSFFRVFNLLLFFLGFITLLNSFVLYDTFAESPTFLRQEIGDNTTDVYSLQDQTIDQSSFLQPLDIIGASYFSDGRYLNTSIWLNDRSPSKNVGYLLIIDSDSNTKTGDDGADYRLQIGWDSQSQTWKRTLVESISNPNFFVNKAILYEEEMSGNLTSPIHLDLDLKEINYPQSYNLVFYAQANGTHEDFTNWVHVPPPKLLISTSENPLELRPGERKNLVIRINSTTGLEPAIKVSSLNQNPDITSNFNGTLRIPSYGAATLPLEINVSSELKTGQYLFPLFSEVSFPNKPFRLSSNGIHNSQVSFINTTEQSTLVITVLDPLKPEEHLSRFVDNWFNPLTGIYQTVAAIIGGISGYLIGKVSKKGDKKNNV